MIILDLGNGDAHHNDRGCIKETIDSIADITKDVVIKFQLFHAIGDKKNMRRDIFDYAYCYGREQGFYVTASCFDEDSYNFLIKNYHIPFFKIANQPQLRRMFAPNDRDIFSVDTSDLYRGYAYLGCKVMCCVSEYPATVETYEERFKPYQLSFGISDHTDSNDLYAKYKPLIYEAHYMLQKYDDKGRQYCKNTRDLIELVSLKNCEAVG